MRQLIYIYVEKDSNDDSNSDDEVVIVKSNKKKTECKQTIKPENSYNDLLYQSSLEKMQNKMMNERAKSLISCVTPSYY